jgi:hypothetical protein
VVYQSKHASQPWRTLVERLEKPLTGLFVTLGLAVVGLPGSAEGLELSGMQLTSDRQASEQFVGQVTSQNGQSEQNLNPQSLSDGTYLYGQAPEPEQLGAAYMVFEVNQGDVVGAFYMPRSSFDCFSGEFEDDRLALTVVDSYEQTSYPFAIALDSSSSVAMAGGETIAPVGLEGFQRIDQLSENDQRILATCKADHLDRSAN